MTAPLKAIEGTPIAEAMADIGRRARGAARTLALSASAQRDLNRLTAAGALRPVADGRMIRYAPVMDSPLWIAAPLNQNGKAFGPAGVVLTTIGYLFVLITMSPACAVFSPVWLRWRAGESAADRASG